jgi:hypothetical protein
MKSFGSHPNRFSWLFMMTVMVWCFVSNSQRSQPHSLSMSPSYWCAVFFVISEKSVYQYACVYIIHMSGDSLSQWHLSTLCVSMMWDHWVRCCVIEAELLFEESNLTYVYVAGGWRGP